MINSSPCSSDYKYGSCGEYHYISLFSIVNLFHLSMQLSNVFHVCLVTLLLCHADWFIICKITRTSIRKYCFIEINHTDMPAGDQIFYLEMPLG